jgi:V/A-type H+-transporting ATPase subunit B
VRNVEFRTAVSVQGGLIVLAGVPGVAAGSRVQLRDHAGRVRAGLVIRTSDDAVLVEVFEGTDALDLERTWVRFLDEPFRLPVSRDILGRVFNGIGLPRDGRPPIISADRRANSSRPAFPRSTA